MLLDSNIIIYAHKAEYQIIRDFIRDKTIYASAISYLETLGYHQIRLEEEFVLEKFFTVAMLLPISDSVIKKATELRQQRKLSVGDAIIAATALIYNETLVTRNIRDFEWIGGLQLLNPFPS
jgi:predicted nucleic acid-binding protein